MAEKDDRRVTEERSLRWQSIYAPVGGIDNAAKLLIERRITMKEIAERSGIVRATVSLHLKQRLGEPLTAIRSRADADARRARLHPETAVKQCRAAAASGNSHAKALASILDELSPYLRDYDVKISPSFRYARAFSPDTQVSGRIYVTSARPRFKTGYYVKFDIRPPARRAKFVVFGTVLADASCHWYLFMADELPTGRTISLKVGPGPSPTFVRMYNRHPAEPL